MINLTLSYLLSGLCLWQAVIIQPDESSPALKPNEGICATRPLLAIDSYASTVAAPFLARQMQLPIQTVYIYSSKHMVMAEVVNANQNQVAYTSFENSDKGFWTYSGSTSVTTTDKVRTGVRYYNLASGYVQRTGLPKGKYIVSYWANTGAFISGTNYTLVNQSNGTAINGWTYYQAVVSLSADNSSIKLSGLASVDELRLYPFETQMTTYTYDPLIGKTSETDANNATIYYEYDQFNRLKCIKDQSGSIRQSYVYHLKNQQ